MPCFRRGPGGCEPWRKARDEAVTAVAKAAGLEVQSFAANVLYEPWELQAIERWQRWRARVRAEEAAKRGLDSSNAGHSGRPKELEHVSGFGSYRFFTHALEELGLPPKPVATVGRLPAFPAGLLGPSLTNNNSNNSNSSNNSNNNNNGREASAGDWAKELRKWWRFGEAAALERMQQFLQEVLASGDFEGRQRLVASKKNTSELSPYIRFGELSARTVYWSARQRSERTRQCLFKAAKANSTFLRRFVWRDLAYWFLWEFPSMPATSMRVQYETQEWIGTSSQLKSWQHGTTGFPLVDAAMRQLWAVGWMPNYLRHVVAQTLIEYLDITWKEGMAWFDWTLVDADIAINSFLWQNGGHSGPDQWEFVLHPVHAAKSCDPDGSYVRRWLPCLAGLPTEYIHRPWECPARLVAGRQLFCQYPNRVLLDLDAARRAHARRVIEVRRKHPEMVARTGHEWLKLPGKKGLLAKVVTRQEFRAETEDFIYYQGPARSEQQQQSKQQE
ncbi:unnamed protein product [Polarella glacialis]|uniref:Cryptochrome/DNA photolyase FAD-binding domain-containing protein n=1 Tax=Polarella glacialis TaxID=89957 RepID=A0A813JCH0_POLGL|nr:unnamed protein product [Polarella glacialis]